MTKQFSKANIIEIIGKPVNGTEFHKYGLPLMNLPGLISEEMYSGSVDLMLVAVDAHRKELHIASVLNDDRVLNKYVEENVSFYLIHRGNQDPDIEFINDMDAKVLEYDALEHIQTILFKKTKRA